MRAAPLMAPSSGMQGRIAFLDGLRRLAIAMVALYHSYTRYADLMPYGGRYANFFAFRYGLMGVQLFLLISGFVILMTVRKCRALGIFARRRWLRLFPAMLIAMLVEFVLWRLVPLTPAGPPTLLQSVPGLSFVDDRWWAWLLQRPVTPLAGPYWSLFVEVRFYLVFGLLYYVSGGARLPIAVLIAWTCGYLLAAMLGFAALRDALFLDARAVSWFASGALFYLWFETRSERAFAAALLVGALAAFAIFPAWGPRAVGAFLVLLFAASLRVRALQAALSSPPMLFLGGISYPFYLIHENMVVAVTRALGGLPLPGLLLPLPGLALAGGIAFLIARYGEPQVRGVLDRLLKVRPRRVAFDMQGQPPV